MWLEPKTFETVVKHTPLVSIDLIVRNPSGQVLLGKRINRPAQGYWFVPGGRIDKDERFADAFARLTRDELNRQFSIEQAQFLGPYEHFYPDNFSGKTFSTHYVVLTYELDLDLNLDSLPDEQHNDYRWFDVPALVASDAVHQHTKDYFL